jgi:hypothetical protein
MSRSNFASAISPISTAVAAGYVLFTSTPADRLAQIPAFGDEPG